MPMHLFMRHEVSHLMAETRFAIREIQPVSVNGLLSWPRWFGWLRCYGYLIAAEKKA